MSIINTPSYISFWFFFLTTLFYNGFEIHFYCVISEDFCLNFETIIFNLELKWIVLLAKHGFQILYLHSVGTHTYFETRHEFSLNYICYLVGLVTQRSNVSHTKQCPIYLWSKINVKGKTKYHKEMTDLSEKNIRFHFLKLSLYTHTYFSSNKNL